MEGEGGEEEEGRNLKDASEVDRGSNDNGIAIGVIDGLLKVMKLLITISL